MSQAITISTQDILHQVKLSCQIPSIVEQIVTRKILMDAAAEAGIRVEAEELQQAADNIRLISKLKTADETWEWLKKNCLSLDDFEEMVYTNVISGKLAQHLFADKVEPWFVEHQLDYAGAVIYEVILDDEDLAMELFYALQEGEMSFPEVAHQYIQDTELRRRGGYRGVVRRNEMKPEISAAVFAAKPPQVLKPIVGAKGVYLIWVDEVIKPQLDEKLRYQIISDLFQGWVKQQLDKMQLMTNFDLDKLG
ncbi:MULTISPECIES: peptidylprolyl isomerase [Cyanophyceae]|uniref:peptidylprolyl isomerase n=1 Tax=Cyanophyceae TaxID=3028117 RepID=UPI0016827596|nr:peptidylprolyl isomerase [Trichocoleus sp. FACHB-40]MBD2002728.1 peptidylprolyl isomerase [Trichocoleus sp. FACHB-40]